MIGVWLFHKLEKTGNLTIIEVLEMFDNDYVVKTIHDLHVKRTESKLKVFLTYFCHKK